jgi:pilus assembly protein CpaF
MEGDGILTQDIFTFDRLGMDPDGKVHGVFRATGAKSRFADRLATAGYGLRNELFESRMEV